MDNKTTIPPFIVFFNLKNILKKTNYEDTIIPILKKDIIRQVILTNWEDFSKDDIYSIYSIFQKALIKVSFLVKNNSNVDLLEFIVCNIYRIYVKDTIISNDKIINFFKCCHIDIWIIINYEKYKEISEKTPYKKILVDITNKEKISEDYIRNDMNKVIFFPIINEKKIILPFGYI